MGKLTKGQWSGYNAQPTDKMMTSSRRQTIAGLGALGCGLLVSKAARAATASISDTMTALEPRPVAPNFTLPSVAGPKYAMAQFRGKVVLVNFWATWCPPCRAEMPSIERLYQAMAGKDFEALALDQGETQSAVFAYIGQLSPTPSFPILLDEKSEVSHLFHVQGIPTTFLVDKSGKIAYKAVGGRDYASGKIKDIVTALMKQ